MKTMENLAQVMEDVKGKTVKNIVNAENSDFTDFLQIVEKGVRELLRSMLETYAKGEFLRYIGAKPYEHTQERRDYRNGALSKTILNPLGLIENVTKLVRDF